MSNRSLSCKKERWKHYRKEKSYQKGDKAICGKIYHGWRKTTFVHDINETDCPRCIEELKKSNYHCDEHGFISGVDVTYNETCAQCGADV